MAKLIPMVVALLVMTVGRSGSLTFTRRPDTPTIVVEGVNNTNVDLIWEILPSNGEVVQGLFFTRQNLGDINQVAIASRRFSSSFTLLSESFVNEYRATLPATLRLLNVDNTEEYVYTLQVNYEQNNVPQRKEDSVTVIVLEAIRWEIQPEKPIILVEGVNNTQKRQKLVWTYVTEASEFIERTHFKGEEILMLIQQKILQSTKKEERLMFFQNLF